MDTDEALAQIESKLVDIVNELDTLVDDLFTAEHPGLGVGIVMVKRVDAGLRAVQQFREMLMNDGG